MEQVRIEAAVLKGRVRIPGSKSLSHRAVICAGLSQGISRIDNLSFSEDIALTINAMENFGVKVKRGAKSLEVQGSKGLEPINSTIDCGESASTLRFMIPIAAVTGKPVIFMGRGELVNRPLEPYYKIFDEKHITYKNRMGRLPLTIDGRLAPGEYRIRGDISSQFISGLMFALPLLNGDSRMVLTTELESKPYVDLTVDMLKRFSVNVDNFGYREFMIKGNQKYEAADCTIEGDFSQAAFWLAAGSLGADIGCEGMNKESLQGDKVIIEIIRKMEGNVTASGDVIKAMPSKTKGIVFDASDYPDIVPVVAVLGALSEGTTEIVNAGRLRLKECDRLKAMCSELKKIGADIEEKDTGLIIRGKEILEGGITRSWGDHRIAMALAVASVRCREELVIQDASCVKKSYPDFWSHFKMLGGVLDERNLGQ